MNSIEAANNLANDPDKSEELSVNDSDPNRMVCRFARNRKVIFASKEFLEFFNLSEERLIGHCYTEVVPKQYQAELDDLLSEAILKNESVRSEIKVKQPVLGVRLQEWTFQPIFDESGTITEFLATGRDITDERGAKQESRRSMKRFQKVLSAIPDAILILKENLVTYANENAKHVFGLNASELIGKRIQEVIVPEDRDRFESVLHSVKDRAKSPERLEFRIFHSSGQLKVVWNRFEWLESIDGRPELLLVLTDVTREYRAREELRRAQSNLLEAQRIAKLGSWMYDAARSRLEWTVEMYHLLGLPKRTVPNEELFLGRVIGDDRRRILEARSRVTNELPRFNLEITILNHETNEELIVSYHEEVDFTPKGGLKCRRGTIQDVTKVRNLERQVEVAARLESVGTLAGGIGHDFNNLLTGITAGTSMVKLDLEEGKIDGIREEIERIESATDQARQLARQLLVFSKGSDPIQTVVSCQKLVNEAANLAVRGSSTKFDIKDKGVQTRVYADQGQLYQAFFNLAINARDAMQGSSHRMLQIEFEKLELNESNEFDLPTGCYLSIRFVDKGKGIPPEVIGRIFDPFFSTKGSSGLGLSITQRIIRNHGGAIQVQSKVGRGTNFQVILPNVSDDQLESDQLRSESQFVAGGTILVLDDEQFVLDSYRQLLEKIGFQVDTVKTTNGAVERFRRRMDSSEPYRLVILDLTIRGGHGGDVAAKRILELDPNARIMLSSGYSENSILSQYRQHGIKSVLPKPFKYESLLEALSRSLA